MATTPWFEAPKNEMHVALFSYLQGLESRQVYRERETVWNLGQYEDREVMGIAPGMYLRPRSAAEKRRPSLGVTAALVDTAANHITQTKPIGMALTEGGNALQQIKAKRLNRFLEGAFYSLGVHGQMKKAGVDQCWHGTGVLYVDREGKRPIVERVFPNEIIVDESLSEFTDPFEMTRRKYLPKHKLKALFPKFAKEIDAAKPAKLYGVKGTAHDVELVAVYTTWRLPVDEDTPGKKVIIMEGATLQVEDYKRNYFPFVFMRWRGNPVGFWGVGIPELVGRIQIEVNKTYRHYSKAVALAVPKLLLPREAGINTEHLNNEIGSGIWHNSGAAPQWLQGQMLPPESIQYLQFNIGQMYQLAGISELAAGMKKPAGLNSGEAQRVYHDKQADRFASPSQQYEDAAVEICKRLIDVAKDITEEYGEYEVMAHATKGFVRIKFSEIDPAEDEFMIKLWPINFLSKSPPDQIAQINDLLRMGMLSEKQAKKLVQFPDLEGVLEQENAGEELVGKIIEEIVENDNYIAPDPSMDPSCVQTVQRARLHYMTLELPQYKLDQLDDWVAQAAMLWPPPAPAMGTGIGGPLPAGLPPPAPTMAPPPMLAPA